MGQPISDFFASDRFEILRCIGTGGMGVVYQAFDRERGVDVALKTVERADPRATYLLKKEFRSLADLVHPNLITLHELFSIGERCFYTMELVDGADFLSFVWGAEAGPDAPTLPPVGSAAVIGESRSGVDEAIAALLTAAETVGRLRAALRQLAEGLMVIHEAGKLHRDIKPNNVLVSREGRVVLLDFGLIAEQDGVDSGASAESTIVGTVDYMSPEQAASRPLAPASDWYSVGVMLYEALTGQPPFRGKPLQILLAKQADEPPPPSQLVSGIPGDLEALCVQLLRTDPTARPEGRRVITVLEGEGRLADAIPAPRRRSTAQSVPFIGREVELATLRQAFAEVCQGIPCTVHVTGESGVGKTRLLRTFLHELGEGPRQAVVLTGRCYEQESVPFKALDSLIDALSRYLAHQPRAVVSALLPKDMAPLARVFPVLRRVGEVAILPARSLDEVSALELRRRASQALRELLGRMAERAAVVIHLDDLQWGDVDSASLLTDFLAAPVPPAVLLLASYRSEDVARSPFLQALLTPLAPGIRGRMRALHLELEPLAPDESRRLVEAVYQGSTAEEVQCLVAEGSGNPFLLRELAQHCRDERTAGETPARQFTLEEVLHRRLARLDEGSRQLLEFVVVAGGPISQETVLRAAGVPGRGMSLLSTLRLLHLVRTRGTRGNDDVECYHDRIRDAVLRGIAPARLREHHLQLALALEAQQGADPEALAIHFHEAGELEKAAEFAEAAATVAAKALAFDRAARLFRLALSLPQRGIPHTLALQVELGDALANAGRGAEAAAVFLEASREMKPAIALELRRRAVEQLLWCGHVDEGIAALRGLLAEVKLGYPTSSLGAVSGYLWRRLRLALRGLGFHRRDESQIPPALLARIDVCWTASMGLGFIDPLRSAVFQTKHELLALEAGEPHRLVAAFACQATFCSARGERGAPTARRLLARAADLAHHLEDPRMDALALLAGAIVEYLLGRWRSCLEISHQAEALFRRSDGRGMTWLFSQLQLCMVWSSFYLGQMDSGYRRVMETLKEARERGDLYLTTNLLIGTANLAWLVADNPREAFEAVREARARWTRSGVHVQHYDHLLARGQIELYQGEGRPGLERLARAWHDLRRSHILSVQLVRIEAFHLRARCALQAVAAARDHSERQRLLRQVQRDARRIVGERTRWGHPLALLLRSGAARAAGEIEVARSLLEQAIQGMEACEMSIHAAAARYWLGRIIGGDRGREMREAADRVMREQGVQAPERVARMLAPGLEEAPPR